MTTPADDSRPESNYDKARRHAPPAGNLYATLALADAIELGLTEVTRVLTRIERQLEQIRGAVGKL